MLVFSPQSHFICADRDLRIERQCAHWETGRPFLLMCWSGRSVEQKSCELAIDVLRTPACVVVVAVAVACYTMHDAPAICSATTKKKAKKQTNGN